MYFNEERNELYVGGRNGGHGPHRQPRELPQAAAARPRVARSYSKKFTYARMPITAGQRARIALQTSPRSRVNFGCVVLHRGGHRTGLALQTNPPQTKKQHGDARAGGSRAARRTAREHGGHLSTRLVTTLGAAEHA